MPCLDASNPLYKCPGANTAKVFDGKSTRCMQRLANPPFNTKEGCEDKESFQTYANRMWLPATATQAAGCYNPGLNAEACVNEQMGHFCPASGAERRQNYIVEACSNIAGRDCGCDALYATAAPVPVAAAQLTAQPECDPLSMF